MNSAADPRTHVCVCACTRLWRRQRRRRRRRTRARALRSKLMASGRDQSPPEGEPGFIRSWRMRNATPGSRSDSRARARAALSRIQQHCAENNNNNSAVADDDGIARPSTSGPSPFVRDQSGGPRFFANRPMAPPR